MAAMLKRAQQIGPLISIDSSVCAVEANPDGLCRGQLLGCVVRGTGRNGGFEARLAMCRNGNFARYRLVRTAWRFRFFNGEPLESQDGPI
jgi:hypothetical protein